LKEIGNIHHGLRDQKGGGAYRQTEKKMQAGGSPRRPLDCKGSGPGSKRKKKKGRGLLGKGRMRGERFDVGGLYPITGRRWGVKKKRGGKSARNLGNKKGKNHGLISCNRS